MITDWQPDDERGGYKVACLRKSHGLSQAELAKRCGVTRQFMNLVEAGRTQPNVQVALKLAVELGSTVEVLFGGAAEEREGEELAVNALPADVREGARLNVAQVGRSWMAHPADTEASLGGGFGEADGVAAGPASGDKVRVRVTKSREELRHNVALAGCDPALALLCRSRTAPGLPGRCFWVNCGSGRALTLLKEGRVHVAGVHYGTSEGENLRQLALHDPSGKWAVVRFTCWEQGWMVRPGARTMFHGTEDLGGGRVRLANREPGSGSRHWIEAQLKGLGLSGKVVPGYGREFGSHWECARALLAGEADVAVGPRAVAAAFGLDFTPMGEVAFDLVVPKAHLEHPRVQVLLQGVRSREIRREIASLPGYGTRGAGEWVEREQAAAVPLTPRR